MAISCAKTPPSSNIPTDNTSAEEIVIGYSNWAGWWPWAIAEEVGLFAKNNVNVKMQWFEGASHFCSK